MPRNRLVFPVFLLVSFLLLTGFSNDAGKKVLTLEDYPLWNRITSTALSADGKWMSYAYVPNQGDGTFFVRDLGSDKVHEIPRGTSPQFSDDSAWVAYVVEVGEEAAKKLRKQKKPVEKLVELMELATGEKYSVDNASRFKFSKGSGYIAVLKDRTRAPGAAGGAARGGRGAERNSDPEPGTDLILRNLKKAASLNLGNVSAFEFDKAGKHLAYTVAAEKMSGNGIYLMDLSSEAMRVLDGGKAYYDAISWHKDLEALAVTKGTREKTDVERTNSLLVFRQLGTDSAGSSAYDPAEDSTFPAGMVLSEKEAITWSKDASTVFVGIREQRKTVKKGEDDDPRANLDVWHWDDDRVQSVQMVQAPRDRRAALKSAVHLEGGRFVQLADDGMPTVTMTKDGRWGVGRMDEPYRGEVSWGGGRADYYRVNPADASRTLISKSIGRASGISPDGSWFLYLKNKELHVFNLDTAKDQNLAQSAPVSFVNVDDDHPYELPIFGLAGWSKDGKSVLLNHRYDLWSLPLNGDKGTNLTAGMGDKEAIRFRYVELDPEEGAGGRFRFFRRGLAPGKPIDTAKPLMLSAYGDWTKKSGYYTLAPGGMPEPLVFEDMSIGRPTKAKNAGVVLYTKQTFEDFPNYYVSGLDFSKPTRITDANPQQSEYAWGRRILVDYTNSKGVKLQATLALPAGYEEGKKYPMLVYFYEKMSQRHHQYSAPRYDDRPHMSVYASDGYLVLMPDIVYEIGHPGDSALDCVGSAVREVIDLGYADPGRIGLQGHSWGGYQSSFMVTKTDLFAAVVTGAPVTNLISFYNELYKRTGTVQQGITEIGQVRMGTTPWENFDLFVSQSPVHQAAGIETPFMILHGTEDGAVDWHQGLEFYNAARRLGKQVILLSYPGEPHHLTKRENQKDFQIRMKQFFDHYLKDTPAPGWMHKGVDFLDKEYASPVSN